MTVRLTYVSMIKKVAIKVRESVSIVQKVLKTEWVSGAGFYKFKIGLQSLSILINGHRLFTR